MMSLTLYDTLARRKLAFEPLQPPQVRIYVCGPTVYDHAHLGHARCFIVYDLLVRHLEASGWQVTYCRNVTDVDDKILKRAAENNEPPLALAERYLTAFREDMAALGNRGPELEPRVTDHIADIIAMIEKLIAGGAAYESAGDVYFRVNAHPQYGKLSGLDLDSLRAGASGRLDEDADAKKRDAADFALWKAAPDGLGWESPWGRGRPGWHVECSAAAVRLLGET